MRHLLPILLIALTACTAPADKPTHAEIFRSATTVDGKPIVIPSDPELVVTRVTIPVGAQLPVHKHPYQRYAYVLEGDIKLINKETGAERVSHPGDFLVELRDTWHTGATIGDTPVELLVMDHLPKGVTSNIMLHP